MMSVKEPLVAATQSTFRCNESQMEADQEKRTAFKKIYIYICNMIKQNEAQLANIKFDMKLNKRKNFFCYVLLFFSFKPSAVCISGTNKPISKGFFF